MTELNVGTTNVGSCDFNVLSNLVVRVKGGRETPGVRTRQGREHARGASTPRAQSHSRLLTHMFVYRTIHMNININIIIYIYICVCIYT